SLASSSKKGRTAAQITNALNSVGQMNGISLTSAQISAIASALAGTTPTPTPTPPPSTNGAALYGTYCAGCHGALASSQVGGSSASQISSAIHGGVSQMSGLSSLTSAQIQAIATALAGVGGSNSILGQAAPPSGQFQPLLFARMDMNALPSKVARFLMS
ncbi:MAG: c-type cytochrome, partial [Thermodesulfovibrionales bacterium]